MENSLAQPDFLIYVQNPKGEMKMKVKNQYQTRLLDRIEGG
ncbi:hypothetical protein ACJROX_03970 [Pseudalkalibacillus sp. A8]